MTSSSTGAAHGTFGAYTPTVTGSGGGGPGVGGTIVWGPDFGGTDGDRYTAQCAMSMPSLVATHAKSVNGTLTMPSLVAAHSKSVNGHLSASSLGAPFWQEVTTAALSSAASSITVNKPSGTVSGNLLVAFVGCVSPTPASPEGTTPSGWTLIRSQVFTGTGENSSVRAYYRIADGTEGSTFNFPFDESANNAVAEVHRLIGTHATTPVNASNSATLSASSLDPDPDAPSVTTTAANCMVFAYLFHQHLALSQSHGPGASHVERTDFQSTNLTVIWGACSQTRVFASAAATGTMPFDCSETVATDAITMRVAIAPGTVVLEP